MIVYVHTVLPKNPFPLQSVCGDCEGRGETIPASNRCKTCKGKRTVKEKKIIEVTIDKGAPSDYKKVFYGEVGTFSIFTQSYFNLIEVAVKLF